MQSTHKAEAATHLQILPISLSGCSTPISLFTPMMDTSAVRSVRAARSSSRSMSPLRCTGRYVTCHRNKGRLDTQRYIARPQRSRRTLTPSLSSARQLSSTHLCSVWQVTTWSRSPRKKRTAPLIARLLDSVAPDVKMISFGEAPACRVIKAENLTDISCSQTLIHQTAQKIGYKCIVG